MPEKTKFIAVVIEYPSEVSLKEIKGYIKDAIEYWGGQFHDEDPLFPSPRLRALKKRMRRVIRRKNV